MKFGVLCSSACMEQLFVTSITYKNAWRKLRSTWTERYQGCIIDSGASVWDHACVLVTGTLNTWCEIIIHLYYVVHQNILW